MYFLVKCRFFCYIGLSRIAANQLEYLHKGLFMKPGKGGAHESFLRPETHDECRNILDASRVFKTADTRNRSIGRKNVACNRLITGQAQQISPATVPDDAMVNLVRRLMFRAITQAKEHPPIPVDDNPRKQIDHGKRVPVYSFYDASGIVPFDLIPQYMDRERQFMRANCGDDGGKILLQTPMLEDDLGPTEVVMTSILEIARVDRTRMFEFFYSKINGDGTPQFVGLRAIYGFGPNSFGRFRALTASPSGPFIQLAKDTSGSNRSIRPRDVAHRHPSYGWGCACIREFMGYMSDSKVLPPKGQLFLTLLPHPPGTGQNGAWEEVYSIT